MGLQFRQKQSQKEKESATVDDSAIHVEDTLVEDEIPVENSPTVTDNSDTDTSEEETSPVQNQPKDTAKHRTGPDAVKELVKKFAWLIVRQEKNNKGDDVTVLYCSLCQKHSVNTANGRGTWNTEGYRLLRKDKVKLHLTSEQHNEALRIDTEAELASKRKKELFSADVKCASAMVEILRYIADRNHPLEEFQHLIDLNTRLGSQEFVALRRSRNATYTSPMAVHELLEALSNSLDNITLKEIKESPTYSIMLDEVCDVSVTKNLGLMIKYVGEAGTTKMKFLADQEMARSTGQIIKEETMRVIREKGLEKEKCFNVTSDGASSFSGKQNGAGKLLQDEIGPSIVMHCHDHRLALACRDAFKQVHKLDKVSEGLDALYKYYEYSSVSAATLREIQDIEKESHWKVQQAKHHRWLSYEKAVNCVLKGHSVLVMDLENASVSGESTKQRQVDAKGLAEWLMSELVVRSLALLADIMPHLSDLSLVFQRRNVDLGDIEPHVRSTLENLQKRLTRPGPWEKKVEKNKFRIRKTDCSEQVFKDAVKLPLIDALKHELLARFENIEVVSSLAVLALPIFDDNMMSSLPVMYKEDEISQAAEYFDLNAEEAVEEWIRWLEWLKQLDMPQQPGASTLQVLGKLLLDRTSEKSKDLGLQYPILAKLYSIAVSLSLSSAEVERLFSHLKLTKSDRRASLGNKRLNELLNVKLNMEEEIWESVKHNAAVKWASLKQRRLRFQ